VSSVNDVLPERPGGGGGDPAAALVVAVCGMLSAIHYTDMCLAHAGCPPPVSFFIARPFPFPFALSSLFCPVSDSVSELASCVFSVATKLCCASVCVIAGEGRGAGALNASINFIGMPFNQYFLLAFLEVLPFCILHCGTKENGKSAPARSGEPAAGAFLKSCLRLMQIPHQDTVEPLWVQATY